MVADGYALSIQIRLHKKFFSDSKTFSSRISLKSGASKFAFVPVKFEEFII